MADVFNLQVARIRLTQAGDIPLLTMEPVAQDEVSLLIKRCFDSFVTALSMIVVLPLMAVIAIAIKWDSPGPAFFHHGPARLLTGPGKWPCILLQTLWGTCCKP